MILFLSGKFYKECFCWFCMNERGQFFLLAAVIISAVVISLGATTNRVVVNEEPGNFYDFSYEVKREAGAVLDYEVYTEFDASADLDEFVQVLAGEIQERSPGSNFLFIYGDESSVTLRNYGSESVYVEGDEISGNIESSGTVCIKGICSDIEDSASSDGSLTIFDESVGINHEDVVVTISDVEYVFSLTEHRQVIFVMQKDVGGDRYVSVE